MQGYANSTGVKSRAIICAVVSLYVIASAHADDVEEGRIIFHDLCAPCHGKDMANPGLAFDLRTFPHDDPARFRASVTNGKGQGMPAWKDKITSEDIDLLWAYVKSGG
jgi:mono/diheme cytochrome c family protein